MALPGSAHLVSRIGLTYSGISADIKVHPARITFTLSFSQREREF